jgi:hypothetical protein
MIWYISPISRVSDMNVACASISLTPATVPTLQQPLQLYSLNSSLLLVEQGLIRIPLEPALCLAPSPSAATHNPEQQPQVVPL